MTTYQNGAQSFHPSFGKLGEYTPDNLINGDFDRVRSTVPLEGEGLKRGSVLARTAKGTFALVTKETEADAECILAEDVPEGVFSQVVYLTGEFSEQSVTVGPGASLATVKKHLRRLSIFLSESQSLSFAALSETKDGEKK